MFETGVKVLTCSTHLQGGKIGSSAAPASADRRHRGAHPQHRHEHGGVSVFGSVGERTREGNDLWLSSGGRRRRPVRLVEVARRARLRPDDGAAGRAAAGGAVGAHGGGVLPRRRERACCSSSTTSSASRRRIGSVSALLGHAVGRRISADAAHRDGRAAGRITSTRGVDHAVQAIYVPADDYTDPAGDDVRAPRRDHQPVARDHGAGDLPGRRSAGVDVAILMPASSATSTTTAQRVKQILQLQGPQDIIAILGITSSEEDKLTVMRARKLRSSCPSRSSSPNSSPASREVRADRETVRGFGRSSTASTTKSRTGVLPRRHDR